MSHENFFCDQCGHEATVFALQPPLKVKACEEHSVRLIEKYSTAYSIAAYDFIKRAEDAAEYEVRRDIVSKCRGTITTLQERCEENRNQAHSRLQSAMVAMLAIVERSINEQHMRVEHRFQQVNDELSALNAHLEKYAFDKSYALDPTLEAIQFTPSGALFKVAIGDCSLLLMKAVLDSCVLLPVDEGMPRMDSGDKLIAKARSVAAQADLAEEMLVYAAELGFQDVSSDYREAASKLKRNIAKKLCFELALTVTEERLREVVELYQQAGKQAKEEGDYVKAQRKLKRGWGWLQQWGVESPEMCLQLSSVLAHFGRTDEACELLRGSLQHTSSVETSLKLSNCLVEVYYLSGREKAAAEIAEEALNSAATCSNAFEQLKVLYFLAKSYYKDQIDRGFELIDRWTSQIAADTEESKCVLKCIFAEKQYRKACYEEAGRLYEEGLQVFVSFCPNSYLAACFRYKLAFIYESLQQYEAATSNFLLAADIFSTHFPHSHTYKVSASPCSAVRLQANAGKGRKSLFAGY